MAQSKLTFFFSKTPASAAEEATSKTAEAEEVKPKVVKKTGSSTAVKRWQATWLSEFSWLRFDSENGTMHCIYCEQFDKTADRSSFVKGCKNYQRSALVRHQTESHTHLAATQAKKQRAFMETARKIVTGKHEPILEAQLRTALYMAKENVANRKFLNLIDLQVYQCNKQY